MNLDSSKLKWIWTSDHSFLLGSSHLAIRSGLTAVAHVPKYAHAADDSHQPVNFNLPKTNFLEYATYFVTYAGFLLDYEADLISLLLKFSSQDTKQLGRKESA